MFPIELVPVSQPDTTDARCSMRLYSNRNVSHSFIPEISNLTFTNINLVAGSDKNALNLHYKHESTFLNLNKIEKENATASNFIPQ